MPDILLKNVGHEQMSDDFCFHCSCENGPYVR